MLTALSVPIIVEIGPAWFGSISLVATVVFAIWGIRRARSAASLTGR